MKTVSPETQLWIDNARSAVKGSLMAVLTGAVVSAIVIAAYSRLPMPIRFAGLLFGPGLMLVGAIFGIRAKIMQNRAERAAAAETAQRRT